MKCLGKISILFVLMQAIVLASVQAEVDRSSVVRGEIVSYTINLDGKNIEQPQIDSLCGYDILSSATQTNIEMINGNYKKHYALKYTFMPEKSCVIEPVTVVMDGKKYQTNSLKIKVEEQSSKKDADFLLELQTDKKEVYVGEPFELRLLFKQKRSAKVVDNKFSPPKFTGFWVKNQSQEKSIQDGEYIVTKLTYTLAPQRAGELKISSAQVAIASRDMRRDIWGSFAPNIKWRSYFSNSIKIEAKPLPNGAKLVGSFVINAKVDKKKINPNEALNVTIEIIGDGNLEDIDPFKPYIQGVSVFDEKPLIKGNKFIQKLAFVADENFTVPSFSLAYYDMKKKEVRKIATNPIEIEVLNSGVKKELKIKKQEMPLLQSATKNPTTIQKSEYNVPYWLVFVVFGLGVLVGVAVMLLSKNRATKAKKSFNPKNEKEILMKLMPYKDDADVQEILDCIESNLYSNTKQSIDKKLLKEIVKKYDIT
jgi:hypothetical protein